MNAGQERYYVVKNHEDQYSIWPSYKAIPHGWENVREPDTKDNCLKYISENWTDMRPKSLQAQMVQ
jgi:MbtH protein